MSELVLMHRIHAGATTRRLTAVGSLLHSNASQKLSTNSCCLVVSSMNKRAHFAAHWSHISDCKTCAWFGALSFFKARNAYRHTWLLCNMPCGNQRESCKWTSLAVYALTQQKKADKLQKIPLYSSRLRSLLDLTDDTNVKPASHWRWEIALYLVWRFVLYLRI